MKSYRYSILSLGLWAALSVGAQAGEFVVQDIQVDGLQRLSAGTVFNYLPVQAEQPSPRRIIQRSSARCLKRAFSPM
jgi:outer membrane protein assembly factor BamA